MSKTNNYILRISNTPLSNVTGLTFSEDNSSVSFETPEFLRKKGKCKVSVVQGVIATGIDGNASDRLFSPNKNTFALSSNIPQLGYSTDNRAANTLLGTAVMSYTTPTDSTRAVEILALGTFTFTCPQLPPVITVQRMVIDQGSNSLIVSTNTNESLIPFQVNLDITFYEDMEDNK